MSPERRAAVAALFALAGVVDKASAQAQAARVLRLGVLADLSVAPPEVFRQALKDRGREVGRNLVVERRFVQGDPSRYPALARELLVAKVDVILALGDAAALAAAGASRSIPIVMQGMAPLEEGLAQSLARPGGNVTGVVYQANEYAGKQIDLLRALRPGLRRIGIAGGCDDRAFKVWFAGWKAAAERAGLSLVIVPWPGHAAAVDATLAAAVRERVQALELGFNPALPALAWQKISAWAVEHRVLTSGANLHRSELSLSFGANIALFAAMLVDQLDRVLRGANPAELPIRQPTVFDIIINKRQLQAMGITLPPAVVLQATEVIE